MTGVESQEDTDGEVQLAIFSLDNEEFAVESNQVREIIPMGEITRIPRAPPIVKGIINLRGEITTVISLRMRFGLKEKVEDEELVPNNCDSLNALEALI